MFTCCLGAFVVVFMELNTFIEMYPQVFAKVDKKPLSISQESDSSQTTKQRGLYPTFESFKRDKKRMNVIMLTHMSSGSSFLGNVFNVHPDVFYLYEPLHDLRNVVYGDEWEPLNKTGNDAYKSDFSNLLSDIFTCEIKEKTTLDRLFPKCLKDPERLGFMYWRLVNPEVTTETVRKACIAKDITVAKILQTRLPREIGIGELERFCSSNRRRFDCLFIHLVRDPRAVLSSLLRRKFFFKESRRPLFDSRNLSTEATEIVKRNAALMCSQVMDNLNYVKENWAQLFEGRYRLVRYEDILKNSFIMAKELNDFVGLPMVDSIYEWIVNGEKLSQNDASKIDHWRSDLDPSLVSLFEEQCAPLMKLMGYISVNDLDQVKQNGSKPLLTKEIPLLKDLSSRNY